jgi:HPt (histidine-containing phosphotransfer) domain-containing protein
VPGEGAALPGGQAFAGHDGIASLFLTDALPPPLRRNGADLQKYVQLLLKDLERVLARLEQAIAVDHPSELAWAAHTLKGLSAPLRRKRIGQLAVELERTVSPKNPERAGELLTLLREEYAWLEASSSLPTAYPPPPAAR